MNMICRKILFETGPGIAYLVINLVDTLVDVAVPFVSCFEYSNYSTCNEEV